MKIYETKTAPNPRRVRMFLAEKGIDVDYVQVDIQKGENLSAEMRAKNPLGKIPILELDDGTCHAGNLPGAAGPGDLCSLELEGVQEAPAGGLGDAATPGRCADLVIDDVQRIAFGHQALHGQQEVAAAQPVDPTLAQD